jgi:hypothetical protein
LVTDQILRSVTNSLAEDPSKRFIWVEVFFLEHWFTTTTDEYRQKFSKLVANGQIELVLGGWVMQDEAVTYYAADLNQMTMGHTWVRETFNVTIKHGWQIDPFGASSFTPLMFARMGMEAMIINRMSYFTKDDLKDSRSLEFFWTPHETLYKDVSILTHILDSHYIYPDGFDWEFNDPIQNPPISDANIKQRAELFVQEVKTRANWFRTSHLLVPWGSDFRYVDSGWVFFNSDKLIKYINDNSASLGIRVRYSTLSDYFSAVAPAARSNFPSKVGGGDFQPYVMSRRGHYWGGFYRSIPELKALSRLTDAEVRAADFLLAAAVTNMPLSLTDLASLPTRLDQMLDSHRETAVLQHHDAITGTAFGIVNTDYTERLQSASAAATNISSYSISKLLSVSNPAQVVKIGDGTVLSESSQTVFVVNQNSMPSQSVLKLVCSKPYALVRDSSGRVLRSQSFASYKSSSFDVYFLTDLEALSVHSFSVELSSDPLPGSNHSFAACAPTSGSPFRISNLDSAMYFNEQTNLPGYIETAGVKLNFEQTFILYTNDTTDDVYGITLSDSKQKVSFEVSSVSVCTGPLVSEARVDGRHNQNASLYFRSGTHPDLPAAFEVGGIIGAVPFWSNLMTSFQSSINNTRGSFVTDDNGFMIMDRTTNLSAPLSGQIFPSSAFASVSDSSSALWMFFNVPTGVMSPVSGQLQHMLHRRQDFAFRGDDRSVIDWKNLVVASPLSSSAVLSIRDRVSFPPMLFASFSSAPLSDVHLLGGINSAPSGIIVVDWQIIRVDNTDVDVGIKLENVNETPSSGLTVNILKLLGSESASRARSCSIQNWSMSTSVGDCSASWTVFVPPRDIIAVSVSLSSASV